MPEGDPAPAVIRPARPALAGGAGLVLTISLTVLWHSLGLAADQSAAGQVLSRYLTSCVSWGFGVAYLAGSVVLGWWFARKAPVALGMMAPLALALAVELTIDRTSHILFPLEIVLFWGPAFMLAYFGAAIGTAVRTVR